MDTSIQLPGVFFTLSTSYKWANGIIVESNYVIGFQLLNIMQQIFWWLKISWKIATWVLEFVLSFIIHISQKLEPLAVISSYSDCI